MAAIINLQLAQQIVDTLKTICSHDINYIDVQGTIIASTDPERVGSYHGIGYEAARTGQIVAVDQDDPRTGVRMGINMPISFHRKTISVIGITGEPETVRRYADLAQRITLMLLREKEVEAHNYDQRTRTSYLVRALVENETVTPDFITEILQLNGLDDSEVEWRTVVFFLLQSKQHSFSEIERAINNTISQLNGRLQTHIYPDKYILILNEKQFRKQTQLQNLAMQFPDAVRIGVGDRHKLNRQGRSFQEAVLAANCLSTGENYGVFETMRVELLLADIGKGSGEAYVKRCLTGLSEEDRKLLDLYYSTDMSLQETASRCFIHKNTLQYRLDRISERCGLDPRRFRDAADLYLALRLTHLRQLQI